ncbi:MAG: carbohydrate ABC transporter permease [Christensenellaceae bacterium]|nr:carbohydrate ABC transporter permease [Christensenellaceae bacterium]MEA5065376.1 carbohydrate ABC transporter permease [Eubacteriales bacterium]MEA5069915.1 carbohydrate ABC transporter permease [Christensenellaceae bacterium]
MKKNVAGTVGRVSFMVICAALFVSPLLFTLLSSFKNNREIFTAPFSMPAAWRFENYVTAWKQANIGQYFFNSILLAVATVALLALLCSMAAFVIARFRFRFGRLILVFFMIGMMVPMHTVLVPIAYMIGLFKLKNNLFVLILLFTAFSIPFTIMVLTNFMGQIEGALEEAAVIDGAGYAQIYRHVALPLSVPALATVSIFNFLGAWNNVLFPLLFINDRRLKPISLGLLSFNGERGSEYAPLMAAIIITVSVPLAIYLLFQEKVEGGLSAGAVKG